MEKTVIPQNLLDESNGIGQDNPNNEMSTNDPSPKTPWHLRFAGAVKLKEIAATTGIGTIYGTALRRSPVRAFDDAP